MLPQRSPGAVGLALLVLVPRVAAGEPRVGPALRREADAIEARCEAGELESCALLTGLLHEGIGRRRDEAAAARRAERMVPTALRQCEAEGRARSCWFGGLLLLASASTKISDLDGARSTCAELGLRLLRRGCALGSGETCATLADVHAGLITDTPVPLDLEEAITAYERACDLGEQGGCEGFGRALRRAESRPPDFARALRVHERGCSLGTAASCTDAGDLVARGRGTAADLRRAVGLFEKGCTDGHPYGCGVLGHFVVHGVGTPLDRLRGRRLLRQSCRGGLKFACEELATLDAAREPGSRAQ